VPREYGSGGGPARRTRRPVGAEPGTVFLPRPRATVTACCMPMCCVFRGCRGSSYGVRVRTNTRICAAAGKTPGAARACACSRRSMGVGTHIRVCRSCVRACLRSCPSANIPPSALACSSARMLSSCPPARALLLPVSILPSSVCTCTPRMMVRHMCEDVTYVCTCAQRVMM